MRLNNKKVLITGAGSGIGQACLNLFNLHGAKIVATDLQEQWLDNSLNKVTNNKIDIFKIGGDVSKKSEAKKILGLRVGVKSTGCSGLSYFVEYATEQKKFEDKVEESGVTLFIDPTAVMFILGSEMDYQESKMSSGFIFNNPNEVSRCGCGESFSVK